jgi:hypothetical protein
LLTETPSTDPDQRTAWNVRDSQATLLFVGPGADASPAVRFTRQCAGLIYIKPLLHIDLGASQDLSMILEWISSWDEWISSQDDLHDEFDLNVAGPSESEAPGIYRKAYEFLDLLTARAQMA